MIAIRLTSLVDRFGAYLSILNGASVNAPLGYANAVLSTGILMAIIPLIILYLFCQRLFVESLTSTGMKE